MPNTDFAKYVDEAISKYTYFVLAASASAIGYAFQKAESAELSIALVFFAATVGFWALSFYKGCKSIRAALSMNIVLSNAEHLKNKIEEAKKIPLDVDMTSSYQEYEETITLYNKLLERDSKASICYLESQFRLLLCGVISFVLWQSTELIIRLANY